MKIDALDVVADNGHFAGGTIILRAGASKEDEGAVVYVATHEAHAVTGEISPLNELRSEGVEVAYGGFMGDNLELSDRWLGQNQCSFFLGHSMGERCPHCTQK
mgnify:CR=1 FL=1